MSTYQITYLGNVIDEAEFDTDDEARIWKIDFVTALMDDEMINYLSSEDFEDAEDCYNQHKLIKVKRL